MWCEKTGQSPKHDSPTRWWSKWECEQQVMFQWGDVPDFLANIDVASRSREKLQLLCQNDEMNLQIELAVTIDAGEPFVKACYTLEGDGPLALS